MKTKVGDRVKICFNAGELRADSPTLRWREVMLVTKVHKDGTIDVFSFDPIPTNKIRSWVRVPPKVVLMEVYE